MVADSENENHVGSAANRATITFVLKYKSESELYRRWPLLLTDPLPDGEEIVDAVDPEEQGNVVDNNGTVQGNNGKELADNDKEEGTSDKGELFMDEMSAANSSKRSKRCDEGDCEGKDVATNASAPVNEKKHGGFALVYGNVGVGDNRGLTADGEFPETDDEFIRRHDRLDAEREASCQNWPAGPVPGWPFYGGPIDRTKKAKRPKIEILSL